MIENIDIDNLYVDKTSNLRQELTDLIFNETENEFDKKENNNTDSNKINKLSKFQKSKL